MEPVIGQWDDELKMPAQKSVSLPSNSTAVIAVNTRGIQLQLKL